MLHSRTHTRESEDNYKGDFHFDDCKTYKVVCDKLLYDWTETETTYYKKRPRIHAMREAKRKCRNDDEEPENNAHAKKQNEQ